MTFTFGTASKASRKKLLPCLQQVVDEAIKVIDFKILDATRGRAAQTKAFRTGASKVQFGDSAHNYVPALAMDLFPAPYDWDDRKAFIKLHSVIQAIVVKGKILGPDGKPLKLRWGGDWNGDGNLSDGWDMPHFEITPWRDYRKYTKLFED